MLPGQEATFAVTPADGRKKKDSEKEKKPSLTGALISAYGGPFFVAALFKLGQDSLAFLQPWLLKRLLLFVASYNSVDGEPASHGYIIAVSMFFCAITQTVRRFLCTASSDADDPSHRFSCTATSLASSRPACASAPASSRSSTRRVRQECSPCVTFRLTWTSQPSSFRRLNAAAALRATSSTSNRPTRLVCKISAPTDRSVAALTCIVSVIHPFFPQIAWSGVFQITLAFISLYSLLGWTMLVGVGVMVATMPLTAAIARYQTKLQRQQMKNKDQRSACLPPLLPLLPLTRALPQPQS